MMEPFRHNAWATLRLVEFCREIDPNLLDASEPGTYGPIKEILAHVVGSDEILAAMVEGVPRHTPSPRYTSLDDLVERARWLMDRWERVLEQDLHPERILERDRGSGGLVRVGTVLAEVVYHGNHHRSQICTVLRAVGIAPPAIDGWTYGERVTERQRRRGDSGL